MSADPAPLGPPRHNGDVKRTNVRISAAEVESKMLLAGIRRVARPNGRPSSEILEARETV
jgi:hypothetical protein